MNTNIWIIRIQNNIVRTYYRYDIIVHFHFCMMMLYSCHGSRLTHFLLKKGKWYSAQSAGTLHKNKLFKEYEFKQEPFVTFAYSNALNSTKS